MRYTFTTVCLLTRIVVLGLGMISSCKLYAETTVPTISTSTTIPVTDVDDASGAPKIQGPLAPVGDITKPEVPNVVFFNFGTVSIGKTEAISHQFEVKNVSDTAISIDRIQPGCGCTSATTDLGNPGSYQPLKPGTSFYVDVSLDPRQLYVGTINKIVSVYLAEQNGPSFTIHMVGKMKPVASFDTDMIDMGVMWYGHGHPYSRGIKLFFDQDYYGASPPQPYSENGNVDISSGTDSSSAAPSEMYEGYGVRMYEMTIKADAHLGEFNDTIILPESKTSNRPETILPITGMVMGDVSATPGTLALGSVDLAKVAKSLVSLHSNSVTIAFGLSASCSSPAINVKIVPSRGLTSNLDVTFKPKKSGVFQSTIEVSTKSGEILDIPVTAWVN